MHFFIDDFKDVEIKILIYIKWFREDIQIEN